jgi:hypothetical protein
MEREREEGKGMITQAVFRCGKGKKGKKRKEERRRDGESSQRVLRFFRVLGGELEDEVSTRQLIAMDRASSSSCMPHRCPL